MRPSAGIEVYLCREPVDFRKALNGLAIRVEEALGRDPFAARLYVFRNRKRDRVKVLYCERNGFVLWQKHLEKDRFPWRKGETKDVVTMTGRELNGLLDGVHLFQLKPYASLSYTSVLSIQMLLLYVRSMGRDTVALRIRSMTSEPSCSRSRGSSKIRRPCTERRKLWPTSEQL